MPYPHYDTEVLAVDLCDDSGVIPFRLIAVYRPPVIPVARMPRFFLY